MKSKFLPCTFIAIFFMGTAPAQVLVPDSLFGTNSVASFPIPTGPELTEVIELSNNYILYGGYNYDISQNDFHIDMVKANYCGIPDPTFGVNGLVHFKFSQRNIAYDFQIQTDNKILVGGMQATSNSGSGQIPGISRFFENGQPDTTFATAGSLAIRFDNTSSGRFFGVKQLPDGRVVCTGYSVGNINGGTSGIGAMRFSASGTLDPTFAGDGIVRFDISVPNSLGAGFLTSDGNVIAAGGYVDGAFSTRFMVAVWDSNGVLNTNFGTAGIYQDLNFTVNNEIYATHDSTGKITLAASNSLLSTNINLVRLTAAGIPDITFGTAGIATIVHPNIEACKGLQLLPGGKYLVLGRATNSAGSGFCMMLNSNGSVDTTFGIQGFMVIDLDGNLGGQYVRSRVELPNGQMIFAGNGPGILARRYTDVSNIPHITQVFNFLETTGIGTYQWYLNGNSITGATDDTLNFTQNGSYAVMLTADYGCTYMSEPLVVNNVGIVDLQETGFHIYPTVTNDVLIIANSLGNPGVISIFSPEGKLLKTTSMTGVIKNYEMIVSDLSAGIYLIAIQTVTGVSTGRIIKY